MPGGRKSMLRAARRHPGRLRKNQIKKPPGRRSSDLSGRRHCQFDLYRSRRNIPFIGWVPPVCRSAPASTREKLSPIRSSRKRNFCIAQIATAQQFTQPRKEAVNSARLNKIQARPHHAVKKWWARQDSNPQPSRYERPALTIELQAPPLKRCFQYQGKIATHRVSARIGSIRRLGKPVRAAAPRQAVDPASRAAHCAVPDGPAPCPTNGRKPSGPLHSAHRACAPAPKSASEN